MRTTKTVSLKWTPVERLRFGGSPFYVFRSIWPIIVDTLQCVSRGALANISNKSFKAVPSSANPYPTSPVPFIRTIVLVVTSSTHGFPSAVQRVFVSITNTMPGITVPVPALSASTGSNSAVAKSFCGLDKAISAVTSACPFYAAIGSAAHRPNCDQSPKSHACDIYSAGHRAAPSVRGSSDGVGVQALIPLRILASIVIGG